MLWTLPRLLRRAGAALVHTQYALPARSPAPAVVTIHDLSFEREPELMSRKDRAVFRRVVPRAARQARRVLDRLGAHEARPARALRTAAGQGRRDAERRRSRLLARQRPVARVGTCSPSERCSRARTSWPRAAAATAAGLPLVVAGPIKDESVAAELRARGADLRGYVAAGRARRAVPRRRVPRPAVALRGLRAAGARGDGVRHARRRGRRAGAAGGRRRRRAGRCRNASSPRRSGEPSPTASGCGRRPASRRRFSWRAAAETTLDVYLEALR